MKAFVINLDKNPERLAFMREQFARFGMEVERFPAFYGKAFTQEEIRRYHSRMRSYIAFKKRMEPPKIAVALSHSSVYQRILDEDLPYALVLEDDITLDAGFPAALARAEAAIVSGRPQVFSFNGYGVDDADKLPEEIREVSRMWCADAYVITREAAKRIRKANFPVLTSADSFKRYHKFHGVELYRVFPATVRQENERFASENVESPKCNFLLRNLFWVLDWILWKITGR